MGEITGLETVIMGMVLFHSINISINRVDEVIIHYLIIEKNQMVFSLVDEAQL